MKYFLVIIILFYSSCINSNFDDKKNKLTINKDKILKPKLLKKRVKIFITDVSNTKDKRFKDFINKFSIIKLPYDISSLSYRKSMKLLKKDEVKMFIADICNLTGVDDNLPKIKYSSYGRIYFSENYISLIYRQRRAGHLKPETVISYILVNYNIKTKEIIDKIVLFSEKRFRCEVYFIKSKISKNGEIDINYKSAGELMENYDNIPSNASHILVEKNEKYTIKENGKFILEKKELIPRKYAILEDDKFIIIEDK